MSVLRDLLNIQEIPTLPSFVLQIKRIIESGSFDAKALADSIGHDPALASTILHTANSAFFTPINQRISSIQDAVARLGFETVKTIAVATGLIRQFPQSSAILNHTMFWRHCVAAAYLAQEIAGTLSPPPKNDVKELAFTCGLLHDIGIILYDQFLHEKFLEIVYHGRMRGITFCRAEHEVAGAETHSFIGGALLELWKLENTVIAAVRFHHSPEKAPEAHRVLASIIYISEHILCNTRIGSIEGGMGEDASAVFSYIGIDPHSRHSLFASAEERIARHSAAVAYAATASVRRPLS